MLKTGPPKSKTDIMPYNTLESEQITTTLGQLYLRISERFPDAGLVKICKELELVSRETKKRAERIRKPYILMRITLAIVVITGLAAIVYVSKIIDYKIDYRQDQDNLFGILQGVEALINIIVLMGVAIFFLITAEARWKRHVILGYLHELRMIIHVIDMHQLTKDPSAPLKSIAPTPSSPKRTMSAFELMRYLDYCSEMYALAAKVALLYAQSSRDNAVMSSVTEIEQISANLSSKVWQKITIVESSYGTNAKLRDS